MAHTNTSKINLALTERVDRRTTAIDKGALTIPTEIGIF